MSHYYHEITHSDLEAGVSPLDTDSEIDAAAINLNQQYPLGRNGTNYLYATRIAHLTEIERGRRRAHYNRYKVAVGLPPLSSRLFNSGYYLPERSLVDLHKRVAGMSDTDLQKARLYGGKGVSAELGHVDQYGDWSAGRVLDDEIRSLPGSVALRGAGFEFDDTYADKDRAKISFRITSHDDQDDGQAISVMRKRAAADISASDGHTYGIVKLSTFLVNREELDDHENQLLDEVHEASRNSDSDELWFTSQMFGEEVVEPFVSNIDNLRVQRSSVLAVASLYFALSRH